ncbi:hypothetical protein MMYC01_200046 [Madurella mycetomatis]|uniref:Uncharacterized protein n=1 Tax=Madurella mycetomatis TaxID=100816 RepID=A0A150ATK6_9PEZI|nr:hypothetical protein MMYC01_200046 [Madurella mycetomatis]
MVKARSTSQQRPNSAARTPPSTQADEGDIHRGVTGSKQLRKGSRQVQVEAATKKWQRGVALRDLHTGGRLGVGRSKRWNEKTNIGSNRSTRSSSSDIRAAKLPKVLPPSTPTAASPAVPARLVRKRQRRLLEAEQRERQRLIEKYKITNDPTVFSSFLRPFMPSTELSEWRWDSSMKLWWREDKSSGEKLWEPVDVLPIGQ